MVQPPQQKQTDALKNSTSAPANAAPAKNSTQNASAGAPQQTKQGAKAGVISQGAAGLQQTQDSAAANGTKKPASAQNNPGAAAAAAGKTNNAKSSTNAAPANEESKAPKANGAKNAGKDPAPNAGQTKGDLAISAQKSASAAQPQGMTKEQVKQLEQMRVQVQESRDKRRDKERILELMKSLVEQKRQLDGIIVKSEQRIKEQNAENDKLEKEMVQLQLQVKTEELVKELNAHKANKKTDAFIQQQIKTQEDQARREAAQIDGEEVKLQQEKAELIKQIEKTIPDQINKTERDTDAIKAKKPRLNKQRKQISEQINEINVLDSQLQGQAINTLRVQIAPAYKGAIEERDISNYKETLDKIHKNLLNSLHFLPEQEDRHRGPHHYVDDDVLNQQHYSSPQEAQISASSAKLAPFSASAMVPFGGAAAGSPSPFASASSAKSGFSLPDMALMEQFGVSGLINNVRRQASETATILRHREDFIMRERSRKEFMEQDKLRSMRQIVEYQNAIQKFPAEQDQLKREIEDNKIANALVSAALRGIFTDKRYIGEIMRKQAEDEEAQMEGKEDFDEGEQEEHEEEGDQGDQQDQQIEEGEEQDQMLQGVEPDNEGEGWEPTADASADLVQED